MPETKPNLIDRVIATISPERGMRRMMARDAMASYSGGVGTRLSRSWEQSTSYQFGTSGDRAALRSERDRARRIDRDNPIGRSLLNTEVDNVIAEGFTLQARTTDENLNDTIETAWADWCDKADLRGMLSGSGWQRAAYRASRRDGDVGIVLVDKGGESRIQIIPGDLIQNPDKFTGDRSRLIDGVEVDDTGRPVRYHVLTIGETGKRDFAAIEAKNFIFLTHTTEPLQVRGESCYSQIFSLLDQIDGYVESVVVAARMAAVFGLIFKESNAAKSFGAIGRTVQNSKGDQQRAVTLEKGMIKYIGSADDVVQVDAKQPLSQTPDFIAAMLRLIGLPFDMPLELVLKDFSKVNLSASRQAMGNYHRAARSKQVWFEVRAMDRIYQWWLSREVKLQRIDPGDVEDIWAHDFMPRSWQKSDPITDAQTALLEIDMGVNSPQNVAAENGRDFDTIQDQLSTARELREELGLPDIRSNLTRHPLTGVGYQGRAGGDGAADSSEAPDPAQGTTAQPENPPTVEAAAIPATSTQDPGADQ